MKNILLPTDFSENALNAIRYALQLFKDKNCRFYLLHTYTPTAYHSGKMLNSFSSLELFDVIKTNAEENINELKHRLIKEFSNSRHTFLSIVSFNLLVPEINDIIDAKNIELVSMGTQGATGAKEIFLGTNTMFAIKKAKCPVLAVPSGYTYKEPSQMMFATDYKKIQKKDVGIIKEFQRLYDSKLHLLNVYEGKDLSEEQIRNKKRLLSFLESIKPVLHITEGRDVITAVEKFEKENDIDLVIMLHNKHSFFENILFKPVINKLVYHTNIPFLVLPSLKEKLIDNEEDET